MYSSQTAIKAPLPRALNQKLHSTFLHVSVPNEAARCVSSSSTRTISNVEFRAICSEDRLLHHVTCCESKVAQIVVVCTMVCPPFSKPFGNGETGIVFKCHPQSRVQILDDAHRITL